MIHPFSELARIVGVVTIGSAMAALADVLMTNLIRAITGHKVDFSHSMNVVEYEEEEE